MRQTPMTTIGKPSQGASVDGFGCLLMAVALLIAAGVAVWVVIQLFQTLQFGF
jgi:hypothetical protein